MSPRGHVLRRNVPPNMNTRTIFRNYQIIGRVLNKKGTTGTWGWAGSCEVISSTLWSAAPYEILSHEKVECQRNKEALLDDLRQSS
jgi:hypothetical protein